MLYSDQVIEDVRSANNIIDIISSRVQLTKKGKYFFGLCPFHNEKTPSFSVDPDRQIYYCYSCHKGGDAFRFVTETEKLTFPEAIQKLADRAHIQLPESSDPVYNKKLAKTKELQKRYFDMYTHSASFFSQALMSGQGAPARGYMQRRMIRADMVRKFGLGYSLNGWEALKAFLNSKGFSDEELLSGGLIIKNKNEGYFDRFRNRVIFPIQDVSGRTLAFGGRAIDDSTPKYMNSPETQFYNKGKHLYGLNLAKATKEKYMLIVEGYMDLISLSAHDFDNVVAPLGTALTDEQARLLKRYTDDVIISFDSDAAGQAAALRGLDILEGQGFRVRVLTIPDGKDPDDFLRAQGSQAYRELISSAEPLMDYKIASLRKNEPPDAADGDVRFLKGVVLLLAGVRDEVERDIYINRISAQYRVTEHSLKTEIEKALRRNTDTTGRGRYAARNAGGPARNAAGPARNAGGPARRSGNNGGSAKGGLPGPADINTGTEGATAGAAGTNAGAADQNAGARRPGARTGAHADAELFILALLSTDNMLWDIVAEKLPPDDIENENTRKALLYASEKASQGRRVNPDELIRFLSEEEGDRFTRILVGGCHCEDNRKAMEQKIRDLKTSRAKRNIRGAARALGGEGISDEDAERLKAQLSDQVKVFNPAKAVGRIS